MKTLAERLTWARTQAGYTQQDLAKATGVAQSTIASWESGARETGRKIAVVADFLNLNPLWLAEGRGSPQPSEDISTVSIPKDASRVVLVDDQSPSTYFIPKVRLHLRAGITGFDLEPDRRDDGRLPLSKSWVDRKGFDPEKLISMPVKGESMEPTFYDGDIAIINLADTKPQDNCVYAFNYGGEAVIKRMSRDAGKWWLLSDNLDQRRFYRRACEGSECLIIGRVVRREGDHF